jgi:Secreted trypsin-like serine protease
MRVRTAAAVAWVLLGLLGLALPASGLANAQDRQSPTAHPSIVGGKPASIADLPWLAYIAGNGGEFSCTGSVVAPRVILTAGHCVEDVETSIIRRASGYEVATGVANIAQAQRQNLSLVSRALIYPHFSPARLRGDAGLLILAAPVSAPALPLASASDGALLAAQTPISISGWGLTRPEAKLAPAELQTASTLVQSPEYCKRRSATYYPLYSPALQLCAVDPPDFAVSGCFGDSGGPAIARRPDGSPLEVGIISTGGPGCSSSLPNIFTRVDRVSSWVARWIAAVELGGPVPPIRIPKVQLPTLPVISAKFISEAILAKDFRKHFRAGHRRRVECVRVKKETVRCGVSWTQGGDDYFGSITVYLAIEKDLGVVKHRYRIHWVDDRCRSRSGHRQSCTIHTRTG